MILYFQDHYEGKKRNVKPILANILELSVKKLLDPLIVPQVFLMIGTLLWASMIKLNSEKYCISKYYTRLQCSDQSNAFFYLCCLPFLKPNGIAFSTSIYIQYYFFQIKYLDLTKTSRTVAHRATLMFKVIRAKTELSFSDHHVFDVLVS